MKRIFEIEFPNELGEMWMNQDNLMLCINAYCENKDGRIKATDVTGKVAYLSEDQNLPYHQPEIDEDIRDLVNALNLGGIPTGSSCSGHNKEWGHIWLKDGRVLIIYYPDYTKEDDAMKDEIVEVLKAGWRKVELEVKDGS